MNRVLICRSASNCLITIGNGSWGTSGYFSAEDNICYPGCCNASGQQINDLNQLRTDWDISGGFTYWAGQGYTTFVKYNKTGTYVKSNLLNGSVENITKTAGTVEYVGAGGAWGFCYIG